MLRDLYGSDPQIDIEKQIARIRIPEPMTLDFVELEDGIRRSNLNLVGILLEATATVDDRVTIHPTNQTFPLRGNLKNPSGNRIRFKVMGWKDPSETTLEIDSQ